MAIKAKIELEVHDQTQKLFQYNNTIQHYLLHLSNSNIFIYRILVGIVFIFVAIYLMFFIFLQVIRVLYILAIYILALYFLPLFVFLNFIYLHT